MARNRLKIENRFPQAKRALWDALQEGRDEWKATGLEETQKRLGNNPHSYDLDPFVVQAENLGHQSASIYVPEEKWYYRFHEWGTAHMPATPFIRPAARKARRAWLDKLGDEAPKLISRRARVR